MKDNNSISDKVSKQINFYNTETFKSRSRLITHAESKLDNQI